MQAVLWVWIYTFAFALLHSLCALNSLKQRVYAWGVSEQQYRLWYSILGVVTTLLWLWLMDGLPSKGLYHAQGVWLYTMYVLQVVGVVIALLALVPIDGAVFLGLKKAEQSNDPFIVRGIYQYIRHPMYAGAMLYLLAKPEQTDIGLHFALTVSLYFILGSKLEEKRMLAEHPDYADYQQKVGAFVPKLFSRS